MRVRLKPLLSALRSRPSPTSHLQPWLTPLVRDASICKRFQSQQSAPSAAEPLQILYCGSDDFSCANLRALHDEHVKSPGLIESIDVVVRPGKRVGRGNKKTRHPPLRDLAKELGLTIHERDTFTGWNMSSNINLIVAVSFGLFVPPRLLRAAKYGGINLHPSLLPEYRGAAPLHWTLLDRKNYTGVTLQTLDDKTFDAGIILAQTPLKDAYEIPKKCTVSELQDGLTPLATDMLVKSLREGRHLPPHRAVGWKAECDALGMDQVASQVLQFRLANTTDNNIKPRRADSLGSWAECLPNPKVEAPKITSEMRQFIMQSDVVQPTTNTVLRQRVLGPLWFMVSDNEGKMKRVTVEGQLEAQLADGRNLARRGVCRKVKFVRLITTKTDKAISTSIDQGADGRGCRTSSDFYFWTTDASEDIYLVAVNGLATLDAHPDACGTPTFSDADKLTEEDLQQHPGKHADSMMSIIKIGHLKMEGEKAKPAKAVLTKFASEVVSLDEFQNIQVASAWD